jgi:hypothetical protein
MKFTEFMNESEAILNEIKPRTPQGTASAIDSALAGGEFSIAIRELIFSLAKSSVPVTSAERDTLVRLTEYLQDEQLTGMVLALDLGTGGARP